MALIRKTLKQLEMQKTVISAKLIRATSEAAIRRHALEDGEDLALPLSDYRLNLVREARTKLAMTQVEMAALQNSTRHIAQLGTRPHSARSRSPCTV